MAFLRFIFFTVLIFYILGFIGRTVLRVWVRRRQEEFSQAAQHARQRTEKARAKARREEGRITISDTHTATRKAVSDSVGEYIEYEEVTETEMKQ